MHILLILMPLLHAVGGTKCSSSITGLLVLYVNSNSNTSVKESMLFLPLHSFALGLIHIHTDRVLSMLGYLILIFWSAEMYMSILSSELWPVITSESITTLLVSKQCAKMLGYEHFLFQTCWKNMQHQKWVWLNAYLWSKLINMYCTKISSIDFFTSAFYLH